MDAEADAMVVDSASGDVRVVAVRGTEFGTDLFNVLLDVNAGTIIDDGLTYHPGFYIYAALLYDEVLAQLADACAPGGQAVYLTGHSLGGAAAEILALWLQRSGCQVDGVIAFAAPLPGMRNLEGAYKQAGLWDRTQRWIHDKDPVPCLPFGDAWAELGHQHSVSDEGYKLNDPVDHCDAGDDNLESRIYATMLKIYDFTGYAMKFNDWLETESQSIGLCSQNKTVRRVLGVLSLGGVTLTCKTLDDVTDYFAEAEQLKRAALLLLENRQFKNHRLPECLYIDRIVEEGEARGTFLDPIWSQRMEHTWQDHTLECQPPTPMPRACEDGELCCKWAGFGQCDFCWKPVSGPCPF
jgi:hypothetical protein